jgi:hypothetical protein
MKFCAFDSVFRPTYHCAHDRPDVLPLPNHQQAGRRWHGSRLQSRGPRTWSICGFEVPSRERLSRFSVPGALSSRSPRRLSSKPSEHLHHLRNFPERWPIVHCYGISGRQYYQACDRWPPAETRTDSGNGHSDGRRSRRGPCQKHHPSRRQACQHICLGSRLHQDFGFRSRKNKLHEGNKSATRTSMRAPTCSRLGSFCTRWLPEFYRFAATLPA